MQNIIEQLHYWLLKVPEMFHVMTERTAPNNWSILRSFMRFRSHQP